MKTAIKRTVASIIAVALTACSAEPNKVTAAAESTDASVPSVSVQKSASTSKPAILPSSNADMFPKTGVYESKSGSGVITVSQVNQKKSQFIFDLEAYSLYNLNSPGGPNLGNLENVKATHVCREKCSWVLSYSDGDFSNCNLVLNFEQGVIKISGDDGERAEKCGFGNGVSGDGNYTRVKQKAAPEDTAAGDENIPGN